MSKYQKGKGGLYMETVRDSWTFYLFAGIAFILLGLFAIGSPYVMTYSIELLLGWVLLIGGIIQGIRAFISKEKTGFFWSFISAAITLIVGLMLLIYPLAGMVTLTLLLGVYLLVDGISSILFAVQNW